MNRRLARFTSGPVAVKLSQIMMAPFILVALLLTHPFDPPPPHESTSNAGAGRVRVVRTPDGGIQPQVAVDDKGVVHLIYYRGEDAHGDIYYVRSADDGHEFSKPNRVNSEPGSAIAIGNIRGAHLAIGRNGRVHVAWMGSDTAHPKAPNDRIPMLYARLNDAGTAFEPQRNVIHEHSGLDGGGSIAADQHGGVYVGWHAPGGAGEGEAGRRVWIARSNDDGKTFSPETPASKEGLGACGCCGMRMGADAGSVYVLFRSATDVTHRDMYLLSSRDHGGVFSTRMLSPWNSRVCVMSTAAMAASSGGALTAWETEGRVYYERLHRAVGSSGPITPPRAGTKCKHPVIASNARGDVILAWTEGVAWKTGGTAHWQVFDRDDQPIASLRGAARGVPVWGLVAVFVRADGDFALIY